MTTHAMVPGRRVVALVQARMRSSRLPGKVMADVHGRPVLGRMLDRLDRLQSVGTVAVATTTRPDDDVVADYCLERGTACVRGHPTDVLDRFHAAAETLDANVIVRLTGDCPVIDPELVDTCVLAFLDARPPFDLVVNRLPWSRTYPIGLDTEVFSREALEAAWREAAEPHQREHVVPFLYENPERFRMLHLEAEADYGRYRWTVDTAEDLELVRRVYSAFGDDDTFTWRDVLALMEREPGLVELNAAVVHRTHRDVDPPGG
jgi:spore coat polysaccharide biosynthesis protein SpsF